jgi:hypothetical protein
LRLAAITILAAMMAACAGAQTVRTFTRTQDVSRATTPDNAPVTFTRGETLTFFLVTLTTNQSGASASILFGSNDNHGGHVLIATGAVSGAVASFSSADVVNTLPATNGWLWVEAWQQPGTNFLGVLWRARCTILNRGTP